MKDNLEMVKEKVWELKYTLILIYIQENFIMIKNKVMVYIFFKRIIVTIKDNLLKIVEKVLEWCIESKNQNILDIGKMIKRMERVKKYIVMEVNMKDSFKITKETVLV